MHRALVAAWAAVGWIAVVSGAQAQGLDEDALIEKMRAGMQQRGQVLTPEQELSMRLKIRETMQRMQTMQGMPGMARPPMPVPPFGGAMPAPAPAAPVNLAAQMATLPPPQPVQFESRRDAFLVNGQLMADPEGKVQNAAVDPLTGDFAYLVPRMDGSLTLKRGRGASAALPVGQVVGRAGQWALQSLDGQTIAGDGLVLTSRGALLLREASAFEFQPGQPTRTFAIPAGWTPVPLQRGDVAGTRVLLLEKDAESRAATGGLAKVFQSVQRLTGAAAADDYALLNLDSGLLTTLAVDVSGKSVTRMSDCRRVNAVVNKCSSAESYDSLWNPDGSPNTSHYYWQAQWFATPGGPVAVVRQHRTQEVRLFDLATGKQVVAFRRPLGIARHEAVMTREGLLRVSAQLAFTTHVLEDARALLDRLPDQRGTEPEGSITNGLPEGAGSAKPPATAAGG